MWLSFASRAERSSFSGVKAMGSPYRCSDVPAALDSVASCAFWLRSHATIAQMSSSFRSAAERLHAAVGKPGRPRACFTSLPPLMMAK